MIVRRFFRKYKLVCRRAELLAEIDEMERTLEGCDWCCGGGDERREKIESELAEIAKELGGVQ